MAGKRIAFVVNALDAQGTLKYGKADADEIDAILRDPALGQCDKNSPESVVDCPDDYTFQDHLKTIVRDWNYEDQLVFYYSGHGEVRNDIFGFVFGEDFLSFSWIVEQIQARGVQRAILLIDACYSGQAAKAADGPNLELRDALSNARFGKGVAVVASSGPFQSSVESSEGGLSIFTRLLCEGIRTGLGGQPTPDGYITVENIVTYITNRWC